MAHVFISRTWGPKTGKTLWVWGYLGLHSEFQDTQGYLERSCLKYLLLLWKFHILKIFNPLNTIPYQTLNPSILSHPTLWLVLFTFCHQFQCVLVLVLVKLPGIISLKGNWLTLCSNHQMLKPPQLVLAFHVCLPVCTGVLSDWSLPRFYACYHNLFGFICVPAILSF